MKPAVIVLLIVSRGDMQEPAMIALQSSAEQALGRQSRIFVHEQTTPLADDEAIGLADQTRASLVVEVTWDGPLCTSAHVHAHFGERPGWLDRDLVFSGAEPLSERGRTLGFEIATMVPDIPPPAAPPSEKPLAPGAPAQVAVRRPGLAADVSLALGTGVGGDARGLGPGVGIRWISPKGVFGRVGGEARFGHVNSVDASAVNGSISLGAGFMWCALPGSLCAGARADALAIFTHLRRSISGEIPENQSRWVPGADLLVELDVPLSPVSIAAAVGGEAAFGTTDVRIGADQVTSVPRLRLVGELGFRYRF